jgi:hypothetical protein
MLDVGDEDFVDRWAGGWGGGFGGNLPRCRPLGQQGSISLRALLRPVLAQVDPLASQGVDSLPAGVVMTVSVADSGHWRPFLSEGGSDYPFRLPLGRTAERRQVT